MYLAGYSIECLLKTKLMKNHNCRNLMELEELFRDRELLNQDSSIFSHGLSILLRLTGSEKRLRQDRLLWKEFNNVNRWVTAWRYSPNPASREDAEQFLKSVDQTLHWVENNI
jgi:hypothetical protein